MTQSSKPIDFNNLDAENFQPDPVTTAKDDNFKEMQSGADTDQQKTNEEEKKTTDSTDNSVKSGEENKEEDKNKLPPATELEAEEENPDQRKIAGEAPYITARNPTAFTPEKEGGVVDEEGKSKEEINTTTPPDNSVPQI